MSSQVEGGEADLRPIRDGASASSRSATANGVKHADLLVRFADALVARDEAALAELRGALIEAVGPGGFLETATVAANFQRMVRIADGAGIPQDAMLQTLSGDIVEELRLREFPSSANSPEPPRLVRWIGRAVRPIRHKILPWFAKRNAGPDRPRPS